MNQDPDAPNTTLDDQAIAEETHLDAWAGYTFLGQPLQPYTPSRRAAFQACGGTYPFVPESGKPQFEATGVYPGQLLDVCLLLFACSLKDSIDLKTAEEVRANPWTPTRMLARREEAMEAALKWAEGNKLIDMTSPAFAEGKLVFMGIMNGVDANEFRLSMEGMEGTPEGETAPGEETATGNA